MLILKQDELFLLTMSLLSQKSSIIEVGAYTGNHTLKMIKAHKDTHIYCFEPVPEIYRQLQKNILPYASSIKTLNVAISNSNGMKPMYIAQHPLKCNKLSSASSLQKPKNRLQFSTIVYNKHIMVETVTLDTWFSEQNNIRAIDLLWIDAQGHEYEILEGATNTLSHVSYIHTEVHFNEAYEDQKDYNNIINLLATYNFIEIARDFNTTDEWFFGNILFAKNTLKNLI